MRIEQGQVTIDCSLQYTLKPRQLIDLYRNYERSYHSRFVSLATAKIQAALQEVTSLSDFYANRTRVAELTLLELQTAFASQYSECHDFQLRSVKLPAQNEQQIVSKLVSEQSTKTAQNVQLQQQIVAQANVVQGEIALQVELFRANMTRQANIISQTATASAKQLRLSAEAGAYPTLATTLGFSNEELLRYLYLKSVKDMPAGTTVAVGFTDPTAWLR